MTAAPDTLIAQLQQHARTFPDRRLYTYLADGEEESGTLTYAQLDGAARAIAAQLLAIAAPGDRAVLAYPVGLEYLAGLFGCFYAGIIAVPAYPLKAESRAGGRLRTMIANCEPRLVLTGERLVSDAERALESLNLGGSIRVAGTGLDVAAADSGALPEIRPEAVAFLQYTSASIADAKGVRVTHANLMANQQMIRQAMAHDEQSHFVSWLPPYHDMGLVGNLMQPLYLGSSCAFMPPAAFVQKPLRWLAAIARYGARTSGAPNFAYQLCVKQIALDRHDAIDLSAWRIAYCGAEPIDPLVAERFCRHFAPWGFRPEAFYPCYGLAEATLMVTGSEPGQVATTFDADPDDLERGHLRLAPAGSGRCLVGCGRPVPGTDVVIVDPETRQPRRADDVGEVWVRGAHVADGYWNRPELSPALFDASPADASGARGYLRTGDFGLLHDDQLFIVGRIKEVIICQGRTLHPTDVERVVETWPDLPIEACAAFAVPGDGTEDIGCVIEVGRGVQADAIEAQAEAIASELCRAFELLPARLVFAKRGAIPRTSSGKKQRLRCARLLANGELEILAQWQRDLAGGLDSADGADAGPGQWAWLARAITKYTGLSVDEVMDPTGEASAWGLDSMRTIELLHLIERRTGATLPIAMLCQPITFETIVRAIEAHAKSRTTAAAASAHVDASIPPSASDDVVGVTSGQEAIWFAQQLNPASPAFHLSWALRVGEPLDPDRLRESVRVVIGRHDALRSQFELTADAHVQARVLPAGVVDVEFRANDDEPVLLDWIAAEAERPFQCDRDLLVRVRHGRGPAGDLLGFCVHHLIADLWSCALFTEEVLEHYLSGAVVERPRSYQTYVRHVAQVDAAGEAHAQYWRGLLLGAPTVDPIDVLTGSAERPARRRDEGDSLSLTFDEAQTSALHEVARRHHTSKQMLLLTAYGAWLASTARLQDFLTGCLASGRSRSAFARLQGLITNPFPVRFRIRPDLLLTEVVADLRGQVLGAIEREDYPFHAIVRAVEPSRDVTRTPLFQNMFVYQQLPDSSPLAACVAGSGRSTRRYRGLDVSGLPLPQRSARFDFTLYVIEIEGRLVCEARYRSALLTRDRVADMLDAFDALVRRLVEAPPAARIADLVSEVDASWQDNHSYTQPA